ncbi:MAG: hypothetical protein BWY92_00067 [Firmicutes bacterium ADurb.BinA052]|jgi:hypothetical protein|nr:hypothetical protein [Planctomycetota bacterium]OPZ51545.1 MAG: hypothetical protein BWY92_00067 [Firmicutes bacterium ADurb.BinA052]HOE31440.1 hypothetical protein [Planctomycetota bacterium]HPY71495.1 hypothetical protein [Planctomycetota bacterium]HQC03770.1 hypothetical protein [Planctomycetota bacterium]
MKPILHCELGYFPNPHLNQIYAGFASLHNAGIINLEVKRVAADHTKPLLTVIVNKQYKLLYDTLDGFNWIPGSQQDNLLYFRTHFKVDLYFKRSFTPTLLDYCPENCTVFPLGFNYLIRPQRYFPARLTDVLKDFLKHSTPLGKYCHRDLFYSRRYEYYPLPHKDTKILFLTRLWDPDQVTDEQLKNEREKINVTRAALIRACKQEFRDSFIGGLQQDPFAKQYAKELIAPARLTKKEHFLETIKQCNICIATTGLHQSTGWKFGEYVAAARAIVSEPLKYQVPGNWREGNNYLEFNHLEELMYRIHELIRNKMKMLHIMRNNYEYYLNYLRPDNLVLNTLTKIYLCDL